MAEKRRDSRQRPATVDAGRSDPWTADTLKACWRNQEQVDPLERFPQQLSHMMPSKKKQPSPKSGRCYWAVQRGVDGMPCLFGPRSAAVQGMDPDERLVLVRVAVVKFGRVQSWEKETVGSDGSPF